MRFVAEVPPETTNKASAPTARGAREAKVRPALPLVPYCDWTTPEPALKVSAPSVWTNPAEAALNRKRPLPAKLSGGRVPAVKVVPAPTMTEPPVMVIRPDEA